MLLEDARESSHPARLPAYLTIWSLLAECAYLSLAVAASCSAAGAAPGPSPWRGAVQTLHAVALPACVLVALLFWTLIAPGWPAGLRDPWSYLLHGATVGLMAADAALLPTPLLLRRSACLTLLGGAAYIAFTLAFYLAGGVNSAGQPYIYRPIDWRPAHAGATAALCAALELAVLPAVLVLVWSAARWRDRWAGGRLQERQRRGGYDLEALAADEEEETVRQLTILAQHSFSCSTVSSLGFVCGMVYMITLRGCVHPAQVPLSGAG